MIIILFYFNFSLSYLIIWLQHSTLLIKIYFFVFVLVILCVCFPQELQVYSGRGRVASLFCGGGVSHGLQSFAVCTGLCVCMNKN